MPATALDHAQPTDGAKALALQGRRLDGGRTRHTRAKQRDVRARTAQRAPRHLPSPERFRGLFARASADGGLEAEHLMQAFEGSQRRSPAEP